MCQLYTLMNQSILFLSETEMTAGVYKEESSLTSDWLPVLASYVGHLQPSFALMMTAEHDEFRGWATKRLDQCTSLPPPPPWPPTLSKYCSCFTLRRKDKFADTFIMSSTVWHKVSLYIMCSMWPHYSPSNHPSRRPGDLGSGPAHPP